MRLYISTDQKAGGQQRATLRRSSTCLCPGFVPATCRDGLRGQRWSGEVRQRVLRGERADGGLRWASLLLDVNQPVAERVVEEEHGRPIADGDRPLVVRRHA